MDADLTFSRGRIDDPYAQGHWNMHPPNYYTRFHLELQKPHGNVEFASAVSSPL